nr:hypothetical protein [Siccirubricoccus phaeus]
MAEVPVTEESLRAAMRDPRYWQAGHPERDAFGRWVTQGFDALYGEKGRSGGVVFVQAYTRVRNGKVEDVGAHQRSAPEGRGGDKLPIGGDKDAGEGDETLAQSRLLRAALQALQKVFTRGPSRPSSPPGAPTQAPRMEAPARPPAAGQAARGEAPSTSRLEPDKQGKPLKGIGTIFLGGVPLTAM